MKAQSRDKIALIVFFGMVALAISGLVGYLMLGHNWNVAASNIDDATGSMEGYTTIVYEGTVDPALKKTSSGSADGEDADTLEGGIDQEGLEQGESTSESEDEKVSNVDATKMADTSTTKDIDEVIKTYQGKKSFVFKLDVIHSAVYEEGLILKKGQNRIAVFNVLETDTAFKIERQVNNLKKYNPDYIVAIVPDSTLVKNISDIDIVISTMDEDLFVMGETIDDTFYVSAPNLGSVGAIIISPSGVVSAKVLSGN